MKVKELIERLEVLDPELLVACRTNDTCDYGWYGEIEEAFSIRGEIALAETNTVEKMLFVVIGE